MSETTSRPVPKGIDTLDASDRALMAEMRAGDSAAPEADPAPLPEPDAAPAAELPAMDDADDHGDERAKTVPHQAMHAEREKRRAAEAKLREVEQKAAVEAARVQERLKLLTEAVSAATAPPPPAPAAEPEIPDINVDPVGHFKAQFERTQKQLADVKAMQDGFQQQTRQQAQVADLRNWAVAQEQAFMQQEPTYQPAMDALKAGRHAELEAIGIADPTERERVILNDITAIAVKARQDGVSFPARLYALAQSRGWQKPAPVEAAAASPAVPAMDAAPSIDRREQGRANSMTIGAVGQAPPPALTPEKIASMPEAQFAAYVEKIRKSDPGALRQLMGA